MIVSQQRSWHVVIPKMLHSIGPALKVESALTGIEAQSWPRRVVASEVVDCCHRFTLKNQNFFQHGGNWDRSLKNVPNFLMTVRKMSWAFDLVAAMLLVWKKLFSTWLFEAKS